MTGKYDDDDYGHLFDAHDMRALQKLKTRLYAPEPLSGDERRDLANTLDAIMGRATAIDVSYESSDLSDLDS